MERPPGSEPQVSRPWASVRRGRDGGDGAGAHPCLLWEALLDSTFLWPAAPHLVPGPSLLRILLCPVGSVAEPQAPRERDQALPGPGAPGCGGCCVWAPGLAAATRGLICCLGTCVRRVVDGIEDGCGSDQPKFSFRVGQSGPECSSSPSPGPGRGAWGQAGRARAPLPSSTYR